VGIVLFASARRDDPVSFLEAAHMAVEYRDRGLPSPTPPSPLPYLPLLLLTFFLPLLLSFCLRHVTKGVCGFGVLGSHALRRENMSFFQRTFDFLKRANLNVVSFAGRSVLSLCLCLCMVLCRLCVFLCVCLSQCETTRLTGNEQAVLTM